MLMEAKKFVVRSTYVRYTHEVDISWSISNFHEARSSSVNVPCLSPTLTLRESPLCQCKVQLCFNAQSKHDGYNTFKMIWLNTVPESDIKISFTWDGWDDEIPKCFVVEAAHMSDEIALLSAEEANTMENTISMQILLQCSFGRSKFSTEGKQLPHDYNRVEAGQDLRFQIETMYKTITCKDPDVVVFAIENTSLPAYTLIVKNTCVINEENCLILLTVADKYDVPNLVWMCDEYIRNTMSYTNALSRLISADRLSRSDLYTQIMAYIICNSQAVLSSDQFPYFQDNHTHLALDILKAMRANILLSKDEAPPKRKFYNKTFTF